MSFIAVQVPSGRPTVIPGSSSVSKSPENARSKSASSPSGSIVARKPTSPKLTANTGTRVPAYSRSAVRIVPSPPITMHRSTSRRERRVELEPLARRAGRACASPRRRSAASPPPAAAAPTSARDRGRGVGRAAVGEDGRHAHAHGSTARAAARGPRPRPARPASASHTNVSRLPAGPGSPEDAKPSTAAPAAARPRDRHDRLAPQRRIAHHAALADPLAPDLELRLDHHQRVERARPRSASTAGSTFASEMNETSATIEVRPVRQRVARQRARVRPLEHGHARVVAQRQRQLAVGHVERDHVRRAALQQAVGEPAGRGADVERAAAGDVDARARRARSRA